MADFDPEDIRAMREQGDIKAFVLSLARPTRQTAPKQEQPEEPRVHIARPGAWPCGTAPSGPSPGPCCPACPAV